MTDIQTVLAVATQSLIAISDSATLDAEVLLCHTLAKPRSHLRAWPEKPLTSTENRQFQQRLKKRQQGLPIAYITGHKEFWSRDFKVSADVLIPRPATELLIELSLRLMADKTITDKVIVDKTKPRLLDLGTGAGIIAVTLAIECPHLAIMATDISYAALNIARENATKHGVNHIQFLQSNWFAKVAKATQTRPQFDWIISNPPYIPSNDPHLCKGDVQFEPKMALIAAEQGLKDISIICQHAKTYLKPQGTLLIEHGFNQQTAVQALFKSLDYTDITPFADLSGMPRVTIGRRPQQDN